MPTHFRWLWYLVGLAGMALAVVGVVAILGSALDTGIIIPVVVGGVIIIGGALIWFRRSLDAAVAAAPSRTAGGTPPNATGPEDGPRTTTVDGSGTVDAPGPESKDTASGTPTRGRGRTSRR